MAPRPNEETQVENTSNISNIGSKNEQSPLLPTTENDLTMSQLALLRKARRMLYLSHLFSQFSEVAWQFCLILFLAAFTNYNSLILVSTYGLISNGSVCVFGATAGRFVDGANRLFVARRFILSENFCVILASVCCYLLLDRTSVKNQNPTTENDSHLLAHQFEGLPLDALSILLLLGIHILGATAMILDKGFLVAMERDWVVVMSQYATEDAPLVQSTLTNAASKKWLSETNVCMKQIDLGCKVAAPAVAGFLLTAFDGSDDHHGRNLRWAAILVGAINAAALVVEYICTAQIYKMLPALSIQKYLCSNGKQSENVNGETEAITKMTTASSKFLQLLPPSMQIYLEQSISMGGISLALLYLNVLTFGGIMTAYLVWRGMRLDAIGSWRGLSAATGLLGTFAYHISAKRTNLVNTGMWSIAYQFACLSMSYASLFIQNYNLSMTLLILGVCASRTGLWVFDIAINQLMQEHIPDGIRGVVGGVQQSLNAFFFLLSFGLGILFPDPKDFHIYVAAGYASLGIAVVLYGSQIFAKKHSFLTDP